MLDVLLSKIDRNDERIKLWHWCKDVVNNEPQNYRIVYDGGNFFLEKKLKTLLETIWIRTLMSDPEE